MFHFDEILKTPFQSFCLSMICTKGFNLMSQYFSNTKKLKENSSKMQDKSLSNLRNSTDKI